jgi:hypothetical protein
MPITRKLISQNNEDNQWLKVDSNKRFIVNDQDYWQFLFGPNSAFTTSAQVLKVAAEFNKETFDTIRFIAYLYAPNSGTISNTATVTFNVYLVTTPQWTEQLVATFSGTQIYNSYFFADVSNSSLTPIDFFGGDTIMVEAVATRLTETYRERIYVNHLGIYDNADRLRKDIDFLDITKVDE